MWTVEKESGYRAAEHLFREACENLKNLEDQREVAITNLANALPEFNTGPSSMVLARSMIHHAHTIAAALAPFVKSK